MAVPFSKGMSVITGFSLGAKAPLDARYAVATIDDRDAHVTNGRAYAGMLVYVEATGLIYRYSGSAWETFGDIKATTVTIDPVVEEQGTGDIVSTTFTTGDATATTVTLTLKDIVTAGTKCKVTYDAKGRVTAGADLEASDIPTLTLAKISDAGTAAACNTGTASGNVPVLDANGKLNTSILPALAITDTYVVDSQAAMLALEAQVGDVAVRTDEKKTYILKEAGASTLTNWVWLQTPDDVVSSVNGKTGVVVLDTDDVSEGSNNLYYTDTRATSNFNTNFALASSTSLADTANIVYVGDAIAATCITTDNDHLFVTSTEKALWNSSAHITVGYTPDSTAIAALATGDWYYDMGAAPAGD